MTNGTDISIIVSSIVDLVEKEDEQTKLRRCIKKAPSSGLEKGLLATHSTDAHQNLPFTSIFEDQ